MEGEARERRLAGRGMGELVPWVKTAEGCWPWVPLGHPCSQCLSASPPALSPSSQKTGLPLPCTIPACSVLPLHDPCLLGAPLGGALAQTEC